MTGSTLRDASCAPGARGLSDHALRLRVVFTDPADLIELGITMRYGGWASASTVYASPFLLGEQAQAVIKWIASPSGRCAIEAGSDTGIGWLVLDFYTINSAGHARCAVKMATGNQARDARPEETWRLMIELETELGLIERFARECVAMANASAGEAELNCLPPSC